MRSSLGFALFCRIWFSPLQIYNVTFMRSAPPFGMMLCAIEECDTQFLLEEG